MNTISMPYSINVWLNSAAEQMNRFPPDNLVIIHSVAEAMNIAASTPFLSCVNNQLPWLYPWPVCIAIVLC